MSRLTIDQAAQRELLGQPCVVCGKDGVYFEDTYACVDCGELLDEACITLAPPSLCFTVKRMTLFRLAKLKRWWIELHDQR